MLRNTSCASVRSSVARSQRTGANRRRSCRSLGLLSEERRPFGSESHAIVSKRLEGRNGPEKPVFKRRATEQVCSPYRGDVGSGEVGDDRLVSLGDASAAHRTAAKMHRFEHKLQRAAQESWATAPFLRFRSVRSASDASS
jgi:hypothetical protein